ncbi:MAG TPA: M56 family metallopeptidase [Gemmatimonadaceae bacterium]|jgi:beta-lactamase regulating signal transducer with metallopeptidase domain
MSGPFDSVAAAIVADLAASMLKTTAILIVAVTIIGVWRGASAARRHTIWLAALIACGITVLASPGLPELRIRFDAPPRVAALARTLGVAESIGPRVAARLIAARNSSPAGRSEFVHSNDGHLRSTLPASTPEVWIAGRWRILIACLWAIGVAILLVRLIGGFLVVLRAAGRFGPVNDSTWLSELRTVERMFGGRGRVALVWGDAHTMPMTFGLRRRTVVIPANARDWTAEERCIVLLHEVAHAVRGDVAAQMLADAVCALLWFHPLIWIAARQLRADAEEAADDCVIVTGIPATTYANELLAIARSNCVPPLVAPATVGMFANPDVERRFTAMLDTTRSRTSSSSKARNVAACVACIVGATFASLRIATPVAAAQVVPLFTPRAATTPATVKPVQTPNATTDARAQAIAPTYYEFAIQHKTPATDTLTSPSAPHAAIPAPAAAPDMSGTWAADSMYYAGEMMSAKFAISIVQTADTIRIVQRGPMQDLVGQTGIQEAEFDFAVPLDGTAGTATLTYAGNRYEASVQGKWQYGTTFVTTITGERLGFQWAEQDRWSLQSARSLTLEPKSAVELPAESGGSDTFTTTPIIRVKLAKVP